LAPATPASVAHVARTLSRKYNWIWEGSLKVVWPPKWWRYRMSTEILAHIHLDDTGVAWIDDTNVKVIEVVVEKLSQGSSPEEMHFQHPHLSLAQIHAALTYYHDNETTMDEEIERQVAHYESLLRASGDSLVRRKLRQLDTIP
jgi:uncharacterized protein (DUF433 family)